MIEEIFWEMFPEGLKDYFEVKGYEKNEKRFRVILEERNQVFDLPKKYHGKKLKDAKFRQEDI